MLNIGKYVEDLKSHYQCEEISPIDLVRDNIISNISKVSITNNDSRSVSILAAQDPGCEKILLFKRNPEDDIMFIVLYDIVTGNVIQSMLVDLSSNMSIEITEYTKVNKSH